MRVSVNTSSIVAGATWKCWYMRVRGTKIAESDIPTCVPQRIVNSVARSRIEMQGLLVRISTDSRF